MEMLKLRAVLEEKMKQKSQFTSKKKKMKMHQQPLLKQYHFPQIVCGIKSKNDDNGDGDDYGKQVKEQQAAKLGAKLELYSRTPAILPVHEETLTDGKRHISSQMEKNRGLTRPRKNLISRKKYKLHYKKKLKSRNGQVRPIKKPLGLYGGETSGINDRISRSIRF